MKNVNRLLGALLPCMIFIMIIELQDFARTGKKGFLLKAAGTLTAPVHRLHPAGNSTPFSFPESDFPRYSADEYQNIQRHTPASALHFSPASDSLAWYKRPRQ